MKETVLGERIKELLEKNNMTQRQLAEKTGITEVTISRYISGKRIPKATEILKIADALNCSCDYLLGKEDKGKDEKTNDILNVMMDALEEVARDFEEKVNNFVDITEEKAQELICTMVSMVQEITYKDEFKEYDNAGVKAIEALEKQIPRRIVYREQSYGTPWLCPECEADQIKVEFFKENGSKVQEKHSYCWHCGQKIDWSETD